MNHKQIIKKTGIKRLYVALAALLFAVFTIGAIPTHAQSVENGDFDLPIMLSGQMALLNNDENETSITVNGTAAQISDFSFTNAVEVTYGDTPTLALSGSTTADSFLYLAAAGADTSDLSSETWSELSSGAVTLIPGNYYLGYVATVDGQQVSDTSGQFGFTVTKGRLHQPTNLSWTAGAAIANWNPVTTSTSNAPLTSGAVGGYTVALYRGSTLLDTETLASTANSFDFATYFTTAGSYHFTVRANVATAMANRYTSSVDTLADGAYTYAVSVTVSGQYGIASVQPELVTLALKGEPLELRATVEDGLTFDSWACEETTLDFTDATSANTTVTLPDNYSGDYALTITANAVDAIAPTISNFGAGTGNQLTATVTDTGLGLATYAFSTQSSWAQVLQSEKHTTSGLTGTYTFTLENNNIYYFYAVDTTGNVSSSGPLIVSAVDYQGYYANGISTSRKDFIIGASSLTLATTERDGYSFGGWYTTENYSGNPVTTIAQSVTSTATNVYAKWTRIPVSFTTQPQDASFTYDGQTRSLTSTVSNTAGTITYQWYKIQNDTGVAVSGATNSSLSVKNVADSGQYYVKASVLIDGNTLSADSDTVTVTITPAPLTITADNKTINYAASAPEYTVTYSGLVSGDSSAVVTAGTLTCNYSTGSNAGSYTITPANYSAANYQISYQTGTLVVSPLTVSSAAGYSFTIPESSYTYTSNAIKPEVTVYHNSDLIDPADYTVSYSDNTNTGSATVTVTFRRNYTGVLSQQFTISQATDQPIAQIEDWVFGDTASTPTVSSNPGEATVVWYYRAAGTNRNQATTTVPSAADNYLIYATVAASQNYTAVTTEDLAFAITPRPITITAASTSWNYDGNAHSDSNYTQTGNFVGSDSFRSVSVTGSITNSGTQTNAIQYVLSSATLASNYNITAVNGTLTVTAKPLPLPSAHSWSSTNPGTVTWLTVSRNGLTVGYELKLYRQESSDTRTLVNTFTTASTSYDLAAAIKADGASQNGAYNYCYTITTIPTGGTNQNNYASSSVSDYSATKSTAQITVSGDSGIAQALINGKTTEYLIAGESTSLSATLNTGYAFTGWTSSNTSLSMAQVSNASTSVTLSSALETPLNGVTLQAETLDELPIISAFTGTNSTDLASVTLTIQASDTHDITAWAITSSATAPSTDSSDWNQLTPSQLNLNQTKSVTSAGTYYAYVKDLGGNIVPAENPVSVYQISFTAGNGGSGTMSNALKVEDSTITLPANSFTNAGKAFTNWSGTTGVYADSGSFAADANDTLTAQWTMAQYSYNVEYYYMGVDGNYSTSPVMISNYSTSYNTTINSSDLHLQHNYTGFSLDSDHADSITVTGSGQTLKIYYKRNTYIIAYHYQLPNETNITTIELPFLYGATITEATKPSVAGYTFAGWIYGESGSAPEYMLASDLSAEGSFSPNETTYTINGFTQQLDGTYIFNSDLTKTINANHDETITFTPTDAAEYSGFTAAYVSATYGSQGTTTPATTTSVQGTVSAITGQQLNVNYYYTRNSYTLTLNVWQGARDDSENILYTHQWTIPYGTALTASDYTDYDKDNWNPDAQYTLADYADWSTDAAPTTMPAGDVVVSRDYVTALESTYLVELYYEQLTAGTYTKQATIMNYGNAGSTVTIGDDNSYTLNYNTVFNYVPNFRYYQFSDGNENNVLSTTVTNVNGGQDQAVLKVYFDRRVVTSDIYYYARSTSSNMYELITTVQKSGRWGTSYDIEPLAYFSGQSPASVNYLTSGYVASYTGRYYLDGWNWPSHKFTTVADLSGTYTSYFGQDVQAGTNRNYVNVYYTVPTPTTQYQVSVYYNAKNLTSANVVDENVALTTTIDGTSYPIRIANRADLYVSSYVPAEGYEEYPGAALLHGTWQDEGQLKEGISEVVINEVTYYTDGTYLYIMDSTNQFYKGNRVSYTLPTTAPGYTLVTDFLSTYKTDETYADDTRRIGARVSNRGYSAIMYSNGSLVITFDYAATYTIAYYLDGTLAYSAAAHLSGDTVSAVDYAANSFTIKAGYDIKWYTDYTYTTPLQFPLTITQNKYVYGRYERATLPGKDYVYYQLALPVTIDGQATDYITETNYQNEAVAADMTSSTADGVTSWYYQGKLVMKVIDHDTLSFSVVSLSTIDNAKSGYHFDDTNIGNNLVGYCEATALNLHAYFAHDTYNLIVNPNNSTVSNTTTSVIRVDQPVSLNAPTRDGYSFAGWTWEKWDATANDNAGAYVTWADGPSGSSTVSFVMPQFEIKATANWTAAAFDQSIIHYFCTGKGTYDTATLAQLQNLSGTAGSFTMQDQTVSGKLYYVSGDLIGASFESSGYTLWLTGDSVDFDLTGLIAITQTVSMTSEQTRTVSGDVFSTTELPQYSYTNTVYQAGNTVSTLYEDDSYDCVYGMSLTYYYDRADFTVRIVTKATDNGIFDAAVTGSGSYIYGNIDTLRLTLSAGYTFVGWYQAADVLEGYTSETSNLSALNLKSDISSAVAVSTNQSYTIAVLDDINLVAVVQPKALASATASISALSGNDPVTLTYGYAAGSDALTVNVSLSGEGSEDTLINGYQWYRDDTLITGANSSTYTIPTGLNVGSYEYRCSVTLKQNNNGRQETIDSDTYTVSVGKANLTVSDTPYSGIYDGTAHQMTVNVSGSTNYTIYYSTDTELTAENYSTATTTNPGFTDVKKTSGVVSAYPVYYYVKDNSGSYNDASGSSSVTINPARVSLSATSTSFTKVYDGTTTISGSATETGTQFYQLVHGSYFAINGLVSGDSASDYVVDGNAAFNDADVAQASSVTMSGLTLKLSDGTEQNNYYFDSGYSLLLSGYLTPFNLETVWSTTVSFEYNGQLQAPQISLAEGQILPDEGVTVIVTGASRNAGSYTAYGAIDTPEGVQDANYHIDATSLDYEITARPITLQPVAKTVTYNGQAQSITSFSLTSGSLLTGHSYTASVSCPQITAIKAASYTMTAENMVIKNGSVDVTDNYAITYGNAVLVIEPKTITFDGVQVASKTYDGTTNATLSQAGSLTGVVNPDEVTLTVTAIFDSATAGTNKTVNLTGVISGSEVDNYTLDTANSQSSTTADIEKKEVVFTPTNVQVTYGQVANAVNFTGTYSGFIAGQDEQVLSGQIDYQIKAKSSTGPYISYDQTLAVGSYDLKAVPSMTADNYTVTSTSLAVFTITRRPVTVMAVDSPTITKAYNNSTAAAGYVSDDDYTFSAISGNDESGIVNSDTVTLSYTAAFNDKDVNDADHVTLTGLSLSNSNYQLSISSLDIEASITPIDLTVKANNQTLVYGASAAAYTASYTGFATGETLATSDVTGSVSYSCVYDTTVAANRNVGVYPITVDVSGLTSGNYTITANNTGKVTVNKAVLNITAGNLSYVHGQAVPQTFSYTPTGFKYTDTSDVITGAVTYSCAATVDSAAGGYAIVPNVSGLSATNYSFKAVNGTMTKTKNVVSISNIPVNGKVYDGTTTVAASQIVTSGVTYSGLATTADQTNKGINVSAAYTSTDAGEAVGVKVTITLNDYLKDRYYLFIDGSESLTQSTTAPITPRQLTVTAQNASVKYGASIPTYKVLYSNFAQGESITSGSDITGTVTYSCDYQVGSPVTTYTITPSGLTSAGNYTFNYVPATLTVTKTALVAPSVAWSSTPGVVSWSTVSGIGNVAVAGYKVQLYKDGGADPIYTTQVTTTSFDAASQIRGANGGAGIYTVKVTALAASENNESNLNVADSSAATSGSLYAAKMTFSFASDAVTQAGKGSSITVNSGDSYIVIAGETNIDLAATLTNATGYTVASCATTGAASISGSLSETDYTATASVNSNLASTADIPVILTLNSRKATLAVNADLTNNQARFSYTASQAPKVTLTPSVVSDNITTAGYSYSYVWSLKSSAMTGYIVDEDQTSNVYNFPLNKTAYNAYKAQCVITATRLDNGNTTSMKTTNTISIIRADFTPTLTHSDWTYGQTRGTPTVSNNLGNGAVTYYYSTGNTDEDSWSTSIPTNAGSYYVKMSIADTENYNQYVMLSADAIPFTVSLATLTTPTGLAFDQPSGVASWSVVNGISENNGVSSASSVTVKYRVDLYKDSGTTPYKTYNNLTALSLDLSGDIASPGLYTFTVTALSSNTANCNDSASSSLYTITDTNGDITAAGFTGNSYTKVYDALPIEMVVSGVSDDVTYQWYKDSVAITGATSASLKVYDVNASGLYCCDIISTISQTTINTSVYRSVTITQKALDITANSTSKIYDGTPLSLNTYTLTADTALAVNDYVDSFVCTGSQTNVGSSNNTPSAFVILSSQRTENGNNVDVTSNYNISYHTGTLTITKADLSSVSVSQTGTLTYTGTSQVATVNANATAVNDQAVTFTYSTSQTGAYSTTVPSFTNADTYTVYYKANANNHNEATGSFEVTIGRAALTVKAKDHTITFGQAPANNGVTYDGLKNNETASVLHGTLDYDYNYEQYGDGGSYSITPKGYTSNNYLIGYQTGTLTVEKANITGSLAKGANLTYSDAAQTATLTNTLVSVNNEAMTITYSTSQTGTYLTTVPSFTNANTYTVYYKVNANNHNERTGSFTFTIDEAKLTVKANDHTIIYGQAPANNGVTINGFKGDDTVSNLVEISDFSYNYAIYGNVGSYLITPKHYTNSNYAISYETGTLTVSPKPLTVTANDNQSKVYGGVDPVFTYTTSTGGLVNGNTLSGALSRAAGENVGSYTINQGTLNNSNYAISYTSAQFEIIKADLSSVSVSQTGTLTYTGTSQVATVNATATAINSQAVTFTYSTSQTGTYATTVPSFTNADTYTVYYKANANNHNEATGSFEVTIGKANITGSLAKGANLTYSDAAQTATVTNTLATVNNEAMTITYSTSQTGTYATTVPSFTNANTYTVYYKVNANNHNEKTDSFTFTIDKANITGSLSKGANLTYSGTAQTATLTNTLVTVNNETMAITYSTSQTGTYSTTVPSFTSAGDHTVYYKVNAANHNEKTGSFTFTIERANITGSLSKGENLTYSGITQTATLSNTLVTVNNEAMTITYSTSQTGTYSTTIPSFTNVGDYTVYYKVNANNHNQATGSFEVTIGRAALTVKAKDHTITFGQVPANNGVTYDGLKNNETASVLHGTLAYDYNYEQYKAVGSYSITPKGYTSNNYAISFEPGTLTVEKADITGSLAKGDNLTYSGTAQAATLTNTLVTVNNEAMTITYSTSQTGSYSTTIPSFTNADDHTVYYKVKADNHNEKTGSFVVTIGKAPLKVSATGAEITYGSAPISFTYSAEGYVNGENVGILNGTLSFVCSYTQYDAVGNYPISLSGYQSDNYQITYVDAVLKVVPAKLTNVSVTATPINYNGYDQTLTLTTSATSIHEQPVTFTYSLTEKGTYTAQAPTIIKAGTQTIYYQASALNHETYKGSFTIEVGKAELTVVAKPNSIVYGQAPSGNGITCTGLVGDDTLASLTKNLSYRFNYSQYDAPGNYTITPVGIDESSYRITYQSGVLTVTKAKLQNVNVAQNGKLNYTGEPLTAKVITQVIAQGNQTVRFTYSETSNGVYTADVPSFTTVGEHQVYYKVSAFGHYTATGKFTVTISAPLPAKINSIAELIESGKRLSSSLDVWRYHGGLKSSNLDNLQAVEYPANDTDTLWGAVMHETGFEAGTSLTITPTAGDYQPNATKLTGGAGSAYDGYSQSQLEEVLSNRNLIASYTVGLTQAGQTVTDYDGTYHVLILLPQQLRDVENCQIIVSNNDGSYEVVDTVRDGNYLMFTATSLASFQILGEETVKNMWPMIIMLLVLLAIEITLLIVMHKKHRSQKTVYANAGGIIQAAWLALRTNPNHGVIICILLGIVDIVMLVVLIITAIKFRKSVTPKSDTVTK